MNEKDYIYESSIDKDYYDSIVIGAGYSGVTMQMKLRQMGLSVLNVDFASDLGGTWYWNRYPGCMCDIEVSLYSFSYFRPRHANPIEQPHYFRQYLRDISQHFKLKYAFGRQVLKCEFNQDGLWEVHILNKNRDTLINTNHQNYENIENIDLNLDSEYNKEDVQIVKCKYLVKCTGLLSSPQYPNIKGLDSLENEEFKDHYIKNPTNKEVVQNKNKTSSRIHHTSRFPMEWITNNYSFFKDKKIAVIGNGSSGMQVIESLSKDVSKLGCYIRTFDKTVIYRPKVEKMWITKIIMQYYLGYLFRRYFIYFTYYLFLQLGYYDKNEFLKSIFNNNVRKKNSEERHQFKYKLGCNRPQMATSYHWDLKRPNVQVYSDKIEEIRETEDYVVIKSGEVEEKYDALILATGFKITYSSNFTISNNTNDSCLEELMRDVPLNYKGVAVPKLPNFFMVYSVLAESIANPVTFTIENQTDVIRDAVELCESNKKQRIEVDLEQCRQWFDSTMHYVKGSPWSTECNSWYKNKDYKEVYTNNPYSTLYLWWNSGLERKAWNLN